MLVIFDKIPFVMLVELKIFMQINERRSFQSLLTSIPVSNPMLSSNTYKSLFLVIKLRSGGREVQVVRDRERNRRISVYKEQDGILDKSICYNAKNRVMCTAFFKI